MSRTLFSDACIADPIFRCPLHPDAGLSDSPGQNGPYVCRECGAAYRLRDGIARLVADATRRHDGFRAEEEQWDQEADNYDARRTRDARYMAGIEAAVRSLAALPGELVLDAGCGTGLTTRRLVAAGCRAVALDMSVESLRRLRGRVGDTEVQLVQGDLTEMPFASNSFDRILCANAIQQVERDDRRQACVRELARVLRPGGRLVLTVQQHSIPRRNAGWVKEGASGDRIRYIFRFTHSELADVVENEVLDLRIRGAGFPLPYRYKLGWPSRVVERIWQQLPLGTEWADLLVAVGTKSGSQSS